MTEGPPPPTSNAEHDQRIVPLGGDQIGRLSAALADAFTLDGLRQLLRTELGADLSLTLDAVVAVPGRTLVDVCHDLVLWALHDGRVGLGRLLAAALRANPSNPLLCTLGAEWTGVTFVAPPCPYPGMQSFTAAEQGRFYGRDAEIAQAVDHLRRHRFLAVIGSSGSGKSSLLAAGILPELARSHYFAGKPWDVRTMRPGAAPYTTLAALWDLRPGRQAAAATSAPVQPAPAQPAPEALQLLVVDQFEELFTTADADQRTQFEQALAELLAAPNTYLVLAARADFYANLMGSPLWPQIRDHRLEVTPPRGDALRDAIALPARDVGVELAPQLVERLLADAGDEPGVLPFIQETLVMLWRHAATLAIGLDAYTDLVGDKSGRSGLQVALAEHADHVYLDILPGDGARATAARIFLRLIQFGEGRPDTRRQQTVNELRMGGADGEAEGTRASGAGAQGFDAVLAALTANRLLTLSDEARRVDLAHEAIIRGWPRLHGWIDARRAAELTRRRLEDKAHERQRLRAPTPSSSVPGAGAQMPTAQGRAAPNSLEGGLLDPVELAEAEAWVNGPDAAELGVSGDLAALVADSRHAIDRAAAQLRRRNRILGAVAAVALAAMVVAVIFFINARGAEATAQANAREAATQAALAIANAAEADRQRATAEANAAEARQQQQAARSRELAAVALNQLDLDPARSALIAVAANEVTTTLQAGDALRRAVLQLPMYQLAGALVVDDMAHGSPDMVGAQFSPDGTLVATLDGSAAARLWDAKSGAPVRTIGTAQDAAETVQFSPDGTRLLTAGRKARIWDVRTGTQLGVLPQDGDDNIFGARFSPDGSRVVTFGEHTAHLWHGDGLQESTDIRGVADKVWNARFAPDGNRLVTSGYHDLARVWDGESGKELFTLPDDLPTVFTAEFSPDGSKILTGGGAVGVGLWDGQTGAALGKLPVDNDVQGAAFSADGKYILTRSPRLLQTWDAATLAPLSAFRGHAADVHNAQFSPDGTRVASIADDNTVRVWDTMTGAEIMVGRVAGAKLGLAVHFAPDGSHLLTTYEDGSTRAWPAAPQGELPPTPADVRLLTGTLAPDGRHLATLTDGTAQLWDPGDGSATGQPASVPGTLGMPGSFATLLFAPDSSVVLALGGQGTPVLYDAATGGVRAQLDCDGKTDGRPLFAPDGRTLAIAFYGVACIWDTAGGKRVARLDTDGPPFMLDFSHDSKQLTLDSGGRGVMHERVWAVPDGAPLADTEIGSEFGTPVDRWYAPDGKLFATATVTYVTATVPVTATGTADTSGASGDLVEEDAVELRDAGTGAVAATLRGHSGRIGQVRFSADGQQLVTASADGTARVWQTATGAPLSVLGGHEGGVDAAAFAPDGTLVATASSAGAGDGTGGGTVRIFEAATGRLLSVLRVPSDRIDDVRFSADGARVLVKAGDATFAYLVHIADLMELARTRAGRELAPDERAQYLGE